MVIAVIGKGMIGSAAARYLALAGQKVLLVGPSEPADYPRHNGVFASHYDSGRITRSLDPWPFWSRASRESIARYRDLERDTGIRFFSETGLIMAGPETSAPINQVERGAVRDHIHCETLRGRTLHTRFPYFDFDADTLGLFEPERAGHIDPRALVRAQVYGAQHAGAHVMEATVSGLRETGQGVLIDSSVGQLEAEQVLVAAGGFSNGLLGETLDLRVYARTILLAEVDSGEVARLHGMPPLIWLEPGGGDPYLLPPIRYPDGRTYLKIGGDPEDHLLEDEAARRDWFRSGGNPEVGAFLEDQLHRRMPGLRLLATGIAPCVTTFTGHNGPLIKRLGPRISVATAGSGRAAKCSDELGRLGALVAQGLALPDWTHATLGSG